MTIPSDTSVEFEQAQLQLLRDMPPRERAMLAFRLSHEVIRASKQAIARAHPEFSPREVVYYFIALHYGQELADGVRQYERERSDDRVE